MGTEGAQRMGAAWGRPMKDSGAQLSDFGNLQLPQCRVGCELEASAGLSSIPELPILIPHWGSSCAGAAPIRHRHCDSINAQAEPLNYI